MRTLTFLSQAVYKPKQLVEQRRYALHVCV